MQLKFTVALRFLFRFAFLAASAQVSPASSVAGALIATIQN
jgi:hypothetical protein